MWILGYYAITLKEYICVSGHYIAKLWCKGKEDNILAEYNKRR